MGFYDAKVNKHSYQDVARQVAQGNALDEAADVVLDAVVFVASQHRLSGDFVHSLAIAKDGKSVKDRVIYSDDEGQLAIEFGHTQGEGENATFIPGKHIFGQAFGLL